MIGTISRSLIVLAVSACAIGGIAAGTAQAQVSRAEPLAHSQVMPFQAQVRDGHTAVPNTRDMGSSNATKAKPHTDCSGWYYIDGWGVNLRSSPWGEIRGHANYGDSIYYLETQGDWSMINDYTANAWGVWIYNAYLGYDTPTCIQ